MIICKLKERLILLLKKILKLQIGLKKVQNAEENRRIYDEFTLILHKFCKSYFLR